MTELRQRLMALINALPSSEGSAPEGEVRPEVVMEAGDLLTELHELMYVRYGEPPTTSLGDVNAAPVMVNNSTPYGTAILDRWCREIAQLPKGYRNDQVHRIAYLIGGYVGGGQISIEDARHNLAEATKGLGREHVITALRQLEHGIEDPIHVEGQVQRNYLNRPARPKGPR